MALQLSDLNWKPRTCLVQSSRSKLSGALFLGWVSSLTNRARWHSSPSHLASWVIKQLLLPPPYQFPFKLERKNWSLVKLWKENPTLVIDLHNQKVGTELHDFMHLECSWAELRKKLYSNTRKVLPSKSPL